MITVLVGTVTGTAERVADEIRRVFERRGEAVSVRSMDGLSCDVFTSDDVFVICTSTTGKGDVPDNAQALYTSLTNDRPDLSHVAYGLVGLGDTRYKRTFWNGPRRFDEALRSCGATRIGDPLVHDASSGVFPEDAGIEWAQEWTVLGPDAAESGENAPCRAGPGRVAANPN